MTQMLLRELQSHLALDDRIMLQLICSGAIPLVLEEGTPPMARISDLDFDKLSSEISMAVSEYTTSEPDTFTPLIQRTILEFLHGVLEETLNRDASVTTQK